MLVAADLHALEKAKSSFYRHKAKVQWLIEGDQSTNFFHSVVNARQNKFTIRSLLDGDGNQLHSFDQLSSEVVGF